MSEDRLLTLCSRTRLEPETLAQAAEELRRPLDWGYIAEAATRHGVAPLLKHGLSQVFQTYPELKASPPTRAGFQEIQKLYAISQQRTRRMLQAVDEICAAFTSLGIAVMGLKELALYRCAYPDPALRPMGDVDLLIRPEDYPRAVQCLAGLGLLPLPSGKRQYTAKYAWGHHFRRAKDDLWLDLQWNLMQIEWDQYHEGNFNFDIQGSWNRAAPAADGYGLLLPGLEDLLFHLCLHLEGHQYSELVLLCDIAELLQSQKELINWGLLAEMAIQRGVTASVHDPLYLVQQMFQVSPPAGWLEKLRPADSRSGLMGALFGNLSRLHLELDEIQLAARPLPACMLEMEIITRWQAFGAMQLYSRLDMLTRSFRQAGGKYLTLDGDAPMRIFPSPALPAFGRLRLGVPDEDLPALQRALLENGFSGKNALPGLPETWSATLAAVSKDPILQGQPVELRLSARVDSEMPPGGPPTSRSQAAKTILKNADRRQTGPVEVQIWIVTDQPERLLENLASQAGQPGLKQLLHLVKLLNFLNGPYGQTTSLPANASPAARAGLRLARQFQSGSFENQPDQAAEAPAEHFFKFARIDPDDDDRYSGFKRLFYFSWCWLAAPNWGSRWAYLGASLRKPAGAHSAVLFAALREVFAALWHKAAARFAARPPEAARLAYWVEPLTPENAARLAGELPK